MRKYCARCSRAAALLFPSGDDGSLCIDCVLAPPPGCSKPTREPPWDESGRLWFADHPWRQFRLRPSVAGEPCLRDVPDAAERIEAARQCGRGIVILVWWDRDGCINRTPGESPLARGDLDRLSDEAIWTLIEKNDLNES